MDFQFYVEKLKDSEKFKDFMKKNKKAFLCSCFFVVDFEGNDNKSHFDFLIPGEEKIFSFQLEKDELVPAENIEGYSPEEISLNLRFDFGKIEQMIRERAEKEKIKNKIQKFLFSLQKIKGKNMLIGTVFVSMMGMLKVNINVDEMEIVDFEKKSFFDVLKIKRS